MKRSHAPWWVLICGVNIRQCHTRTDAVRAVRQNYNANAREQRRCFAVDVAWRPLADWRAPIVYVPEQVA